MTHDARPDHPERILVCVGPSPSSPSLVRGARRLADDLHASLVAAYVEAPDAHPAGRKDRERLQSTLRLAESLGGEVVRLEGSRVSEALLGYARAHGVTRIVVGKPTHGPWRDRLRGSLVNQLVRGSGDIEVRFLPGDEEVPEPALQRRWAPRRADAVGIVLAALLAAAATGIGILGRAVLSQADVVVLFLLGIMVVSFQFGRLPSLVSSALSVAAYDFFFVPPLYAFSVEQTRHLLTFAMMFVVGLVLSGLTQRLRRHERETRDREARTAELYAFTREMAGLVDLDRVAEITVRHAAEAFGGHTVLLVRGPSGDWSARARSAPGADPDDAVCALAAAAADSGRPVGRGTIRRNDAAWTCVPVAGTGPDPAVLALRNAGLERLAAEGHGFLDAFARQAALALGRARLADEARAAVLKARTEEMRSSLLSTVSHDLRTPLAAITGAGTALRDERGRLDAGGRAELVDTICHEAERMERLVANVLDMVRLESGGIAPKREWVPLEEIVGSALARLERRLAGRDVRLDLPDPLPLVSVDPVLFEQVVVNLVENSVRHGRASSPIEIAARATPGAVEIEVADRGPGIPPGHEERVFEKFYRGPGARSGGVGLGLPICRGIVEAHGGTVTAHNRDGGGARFLVRLPVEGAPPDLPVADEPVPDEEQRT
jgi:two-component system sensor histidine kinase KdpD